MKLKYNIFASLFLGTITIEQTNAVDCPKAFTRNEFLQTYKKIGDQNEERTLELLEKNNYYINAWGMDPDSHAVPHEVTRKTCPYKFADTEGEVSVFVLKKLK